MDWQPYINLGAGVVLAAGGWFLRELWDAIQKLKDDLKALEVKLPSEYVRKDDLTESMDRVYKALDRIERKLDQKADK